MEPEKASSKLLHWSLYGAFVIVAVLITARLVIWNVFESPEERGTFGDMFGAVNALFSGLAFLGVIVAIILQKMELEEQRREIRESRIAHQKSADALDGQLKSSKLQVEIESLNRIIQFLRGKIERYQYRSDGRSVFILDRKNYDSTNAEIKRYEQLLETRIRNYFNKLENSESDAENLEANA